MHISVVIPTCDRKQALLSLLENLCHSSYPIAEVIIVDAGNDRLCPSDYSTFEDLNIRYRPSPKSVCIQRNAGIRMAKAPWIFLCDDDMEVPPNYLQELATHWMSHPEAGVISGLVLQKEDHEWKASYPVSSATTLLWKYTFQLGIWGEINCSIRHGFTKRIKAYYTQKGNHISKAGWPVVTDFSGDYFITPVYGLGASLIKKEWLLRSPYDEVLDNHGIGDHYGVAAGFPVREIHVVKNALVYHHQSAVNRLQQPLQYFRRILALDYFIRKQPALKQVKRRWLLWSLAGHLLAFTWVGDRKMIGSSLRAICSVAFGQNPYDGVSGPERQRSGTASNPGKKT